MRNELNNLNKRMNSLFNYIHSNKSFNKLSEYGKAILVQQYEAMATYYRCLIRRFFYDKQESELPPVFTFVDAIVLLNNGFLVRREDWEDNVMLFKQETNVVTNIEFNNIKSPLPDEVFQVINSSRKSYQRLFHKYMMYHKGGKCITEWVPTEEDLYAEDWEVIDINNNDYKRRGKEFIMNELFKIKNNENKK